MKVIDHIFTVVFMVLGSALMSYVNALVGHDLIRTVLLVAGFAMAITPCIMFG